MRTSGLLAVVLGLLASACQSAMPEEQFPGPIACPPASNGQLGEITIIPSGASASFTPTEQHGPCGCRVLYSRGGAPLDMAPPRDGEVVAPTAGQITITGDRTIVLSPDSNGLYEPYAAVDGGAIFSAPAKMLTVSAPGGIAPPPSARVTAVVPAFSATLTTPSDMVVDSTNAQKDGFALTWHGADQLVEVDFSGSGFEFAETMRCTFAGPPGKGFIPSAALSDFGSDTRFEIQSAAATLVPAGSWNVLLDVNRSQLLLPGRQPYFSANLGRSTP